MRGDEKQQDAMFSYINLEQRVPAAHPLRAIRQMVDQALGDLSQHFDTLYARGGRPSIPPEQLLRALLLQVLYGLRSERQLMEQVAYNLLYRWFVGLAMDEAAWDATVYSKNRDRLLQGEVSQRLLLAVVEQARAQSLLREEHFTVDGTLLEAWAKLLRFAQASSRVASTIKCSPLSGLGARACSTTASSKRCDTSPASRRSRFLLNTVVSQAASSIPSPTNHRNSRLKSICSISCRSLRIAYSTCNSRARSSCSGGIEGRPRRAYSASKCNDRSAKA